MRFYVEPEFRSGQLHPARYRLHASGPGKWSGILGSITDAELAHRIVELLNADAQTRVGGLR